MSLLSGFFSLSKDVNKVKSEDSSDTAEGVVSDLLPELVLDMKDEELIRLKNSWTDNWEPYSKEVAKKQKENEEYWLGKHFAQDSEKRPLVDNLIYESLETFLPIATRPKADPLVESDASDAGTALADKVRKFLIHTSDRLSFNLKMKQVARYWAIYLLGVMKVGWSEIDNDITCKPIRPQKLILDPDATIEGCVYTGYYIGEYVENTASDLILRFPGKKDFILNKVNQKTGTKVQYIQWCTNDYMFWTCENEVLGKIKNPHWNYGSQVQAPVDELGQQPIDEQGNPVMVDEPGVNHFSSPQMPYIFLSIMNLGLHPHDDTNPIIQNLPIQDLINKRLAQIDKNADGANGGLIVSGDSFTEEQAMNASNLLRRGGTIFVPTGDVNTAVRRDTGTALPQFVYESLLDYRNELRNIFGTRGSTPQGTVTEQTVGGKQIIKGQDADRIGGGISVYLEQFSDRVFNWFVQLMYVYYDEEHSATVLGKEKAREYITLINTEFKNTGKLLIGVKEGSMIPHDPESQRGEALELWSNDGIDPITFFDRLEFPNPREAAKNLYLWKADPIKLFPDLLEEQVQEQAVIAQEQQNQQKNQMAQEAEVEQQRMAQEQANKLQQIELQNLVKSV